MADPNVRQVAYPPALEDAERDFLRGSPDTPLVGVALSGGGIRSATFCLGVFQSLARLGLLNRVRYLSTVSGGGYLGAFLGRLFTRDWIRDVADVEAILTRTPPSTQPPPDAPSPTAPFDWLRENGRYLSPRGPGDLLLGGAALLRNWVAVHVVLATLVLFAFLTLQLVRGAAEVTLGGTAWWVTTRATLMRALPWAERIWWSPWALLAPALVFLWALPFGWAYWLVVSWPGRRWVVRGWVHPVFEVLVAIVVLALSFWRSAPGLAREAVGVLLVAALLTLVWWRVAWLLARRGVEAREHEPDTRRKLFELANTRNWLSARLKDALVGTAIVAAVALVDSLGQTVYVLARAGRFHPAPWAVGLFGSLAGIAAFARQLVLLFGGKPGARPRVPVTIVATAAAAVIALVVLTALNAVSHAVAWDLRRLEGTSTLLSGAEAWRHADASSLWPPLLVSGVALVFSLLLGHSRTFLNQSSHHSLYTARLARAYLGASNRRRVGPSGTPVTQVIEGDDIALDGYWAGLSRSSGLIHLINVTVNETLDGKSQVEQRDRKGTGMAVGPAGLSVGVRHHAVFDARAGNGTAPRRVMIYPEPAGSYRVFEYADGRYAGEPLSLGQWVAISGAAFSTGLGARTSLGLSLLTGFGNVRLGYWWDSGVDPAARLGVSGGRSTHRLGDVLRALFPVQGSLLDEFLARFHGPARQEWYLSDGGHFENLGAYELIRRRLPVIVVVDAEADPDYTFEGLANLVRKARLDFRAEVRFLTEGELDALLHPEVRSYFGAIDQLRRGRWMEEPVSEPGAPGRDRRSIDAVDTARLSLAHAALAQVQYEDADGEESWLLYLKPTLTGGEPADVLQYHVSHPAFPQEPTADQFFDEAQWESYRKLGEHIAGHVFAAVADPQAAPFVPWLLRPPRSRAPASACARCGEGAGAS